jgi:uncharacterized membrane protein
VKTAVPSFRAGAGDRDLEERIETLRRELAGLVVRLSNASHQLDDLAEELRSHRQADNVVDLGQRPRRKRGRAPDILGDFLE